MQFYEYKPMSVEDTVKSISMTQDRNRKLSRKSPACCPKKSYLKTEIEELKEVNNQMRAWIYKRVQSDNTNDI